MVAIWSVHHKTWQVIYYCALLAEQMPGLELRYEEKEPSSITTKAHVFRGALFLRRSLRKTEIQMHNMKGREKSLLFWQEVRLSTIHFFFTFSGVCPLTFIPRAHNTKIYLSENQTADCKRDLRKD
jgi:hypothetical protein